jgi:hypothetical protein
MTWTLGYRQYSGPHLLSYLAVYMISLGISLNLMHLLVQFIDVTPEIATAICILVTALTNFIGIKWGV